MNIYVGNLSYEVTEEELRNEFAAFGDVASVNIIKDKYSGQSKGFAFVEMSTRREAQKAISMLNKRGFMEKELLVKEARVRPGFRGRRY